ncbi:MAG TPA: prepilin-type N-terminal cleavage/methylation domain-containing protein [Candidatus Deferrimicrobiaceae bacterium]|jgi:type II secretion system protein I|nr:prepilin-type N-terminal cleavage/methylation domain-containing protein [Candidatus Deferrimicrobiaceae bacterium]
MSRGFTLLEVLVAVAILAVAIVALMQLASQGLRLLHRADDYQQAVIVADRVARAGEAIEEGVDAGRDGRFQWERRVTLVPVPEELAPGAGPQLRLYALTVGVRWGHNQTLELASLRAVSEDSAR